MKLNPTATAPRAVTHNGAVVFAASPAQQLERLVMNTMLFESQFYASGQTTADQIAALVRQLPAETALAVAIKGRQVGHLRHAPLFVLREVARKKSVKGLDQAIAVICDRPDMMTDLLALYWKEKRQPVSNPVKRGLGEAFKRFNEYTLQKYNRPTAIKLRDILRICHPKPNNEAQADMWRRLIADELATPDTWEVAISKCHTHEAKRDEWTRLLKENKLGGLALLRNVRNMVQCGVEQRAIGAAFEVNNFNRVLPFQFFKAAEVVPSLEPVIDAAMLKAVANLPRIDGKTIVLVDVSGSMAGDRMQYATAAAALAREVFNAISVYSFSTHLRPVPARRGMALRDAIIQSQPHSSTNLREAINGLPAGYQRLIIITDEQANDNIPQAATDKCYIINVAAYAAGVGYLRGYHHINGISNRVFDYIAYSEGRELVVENEE